MTKSFKGSTYGEITTEGIDALINEFKEHFNNPDSVFYDLGSGKGDMVIYVASNTPVKKSCGIELHKERFDISQEKLNKLSLDNVSFLNENFLESDISDATIIYIDNLLIPDDVQTQLWENIPDGALVISTLKLKEKDSIKYRSTKKPIRRSYANLKSLYTIK